MAQLLVRNVEDSVRDSLRRRAQRHGHSMEAEIREILRAAAQEDGAHAMPLGSRISSRFAGIGLDADLPEMRGQGARPADF